mgnify:CR=1 FL=1
MSKPKIKSVNELKRIVKRYFKNCDTESIPYTMSGLAAALGISRRTLKDYSQRDDYGEAVSGFKQKIEAQMEERMLLGTSAASPSQFSLKNNFGWNDKVEIETYGEVTVKTAKEIPTSTLIKLLPSHMIEDIQKHSKAAYEIEELEEQNNNTYKNKGNMAKQ